MLELIICIVIIAVLVTVIGIQRAKINELKTLTIKWYRRADELNLQATRQKLYIEYIEQELSQLLNKDEITAEDIEDILCGYEEPPIF